MIEFEECSPFTSPICFYTVFLFRFFPLPAQPAAAAAALAVRSARFSERAVVYAVVLVFCGQSTVFQFMVTKPVSMQFRLP